MAVNALHDRCRGQTSADESGILLGHDHDNPFHRPTRIDTVLTPVSYAIYGSIKISNFVHNSSSKQVGNVLFLTKTQLRSIMVILM